jgi:two-component system, NtrC family, response regulator HydG
MKNEIMIVEDQFIEANNLRLILDRAGYSVAPIAFSFKEAIEILESHKPDMVLLDIYLNGSLTGIDVAKVLVTKKIPFVYLSANSDKKVFLSAKATKPYGFLVKPFRQRDVLATLEVAFELHDVMQKTPLNVRVNDEKRNESRNNVPGILTRSKLMQNVMEHIQLVGPSASTVLISGESGTGKELVALSIHETSNRKSRPFVVVNCGALPVNLIESELFGHEKGAFTGAIEKRIGKFEQANGGTIFLDEVGELPLDTQAKFLRVLQEKEIEPIGGKTRKVDVRIIAATNRSLEDDVAEGKFRMDLYYRLNVFPISVPALRERKEDIMLLAAHFLKRVAHDEGKMITGFSDDVIQKMESYHWPGNVRELENLIRRTVLLTTTGVVNEFYRQPESLKSATTTEKLKSIAENERDHIIAALKKCNWKVYGPGGAAELLEINVSTLNSRIKKLGIEKIRVSEKRE